MPKTRSLTDLGASRLRGRRVLARVDYNVPLDDDGRVVDATRVDATLPTLEFLRNAGARTILLSHLGRPGGAADPQYSLKPVAEFLTRRLAVDVPLLTDPPGSAKLARAIDELPEGGLVLLENIRFHPGETANDDAFSSQLASLADDFVGDAFGVAHRAHASNVGAARRIREKGGAAVAGFLLERELRFLREAMREPERPFVAVMGGAKISGKIDLIQSILPLVDRLLIGGAMANTFFRAMGFEVGASLVEEDRIEMAGELLEAAGPRMLLPMDCIVADAIDEEAAHGEADRGEVGPSDLIVDIGPRTRALYRSELLAARTILWNGPMGIFELAPFAEGTYAVARATAEAAEGGALAVVGGGDSIVAAEAAGVRERMTHVSTGGGASLDLLAGRELPGVEVLEMVEDPHGKEGRQ